MIMVPALFALAIQHSNFNIEFLSKLGSKYAFFICIMHPVFMHVFDATILNASEAIKYVFRPKYYDYICVAFKNYNCFV